MRLIDVDVLVAELKERHENIMQDPEVSKRMKWCEAVHYGATTKIIEKMPTIEATTVAHGRWVCVSNFLSPVSGRGQHKCSICEDYYTTDAKNMYFCPNCGAKMVEIEHPAQYGPKYDFVDGKWKTVHGLIRDSFVETRTEAVFPNCGAKMDGGVSDG